MAAQRPQGRRGVEAAEYGQRAAGEQRVRAEADETVWYIGEQTRCRSAGSKCHTAASSSKTARAVASSHSPVVTPLGRPVVPDV